MDKINEIDILALTTRINQVNVLSKSMLSNIKASPMFDLFLSITFEIKDYNEEYQRILESLKKSAIDLGYFAEEINNLLKGEN